MQMMHHDANADRFSHTSYYIRGDIFIARSIIIIITR